MMKMKHLFYALLTILIVSSCTVDNPVVNPEPQQPSYRDILAGGIKGTGH